MAVDLKFLLEKEITRLEKDIARETSVLASLRDELTKHEKAYELLEEDRPPKPRVSTRVRTSGRLDWASVLASLPTTFDIDTVAATAAVKGKPRHYVRQMILRWAKERKIQWIAEGRYRKSK
jgi:DNA gyrase/topoisomerase IV subunit A